MNKLLLLFILSVCFIACRMVHEGDDFEEPEQQATIIGKWICTNLNYFHTDSANVYINTIYSGPFTGQADRIEYLQFTPDSLYIKMGNEKVADIVPLKYYYNTQKQIILVKDSVSIDTLFYLLATPKNELVFSQRESDTVNNLIVITRYNYNAKRQN